MPRVCTCDRWQSSGFRPGVDCLACHLWHTDAGYHAHHGGKAAPGRGRPAPAPALPDCAELGPPLPGQEGCGCVTKKRGCAVHVVCTTLAVLPPVGPPVRSCDACPEHTARPLGVK